MTLFSICYIQDCLRCGLDKTETVFNVISAFEVPVFIYNAERKKFLKLDDGSTHAVIPQLFDVPAVKASLYKNRYTMFQDNLKDYDQINDRYGTECEH